LGVVTVAAAAVLGFKYAEHPQFGEIATAAFYLAWLWGVLLIGVLAVVFGWFKRAWIDGPAGRLMNQRMDLSSLVG
jgi:hypothetical protein